MKKLTTLLIMAVIAPCLCSCGGGGAAVATDAGEIDALRQELRLAGTPVPSPEQYLAARNDFVSVMAAVLSEQQRLTGSSAAGIKRTVGSVAATAGLGGLIASLLVEDEDTKTSLAQASAGAAGVAGLAMLIPLGNVPASAEPVRRYLEVQLPEFEERWPPHRDVPLELDEWQGFLRDTEQMERVVEALAK